MTVLRMTLWGLAAAAIVGFVVLTATQNRPAPRTTDLGGVAESIGGPFTLVDQNGAMRTEADFKGRPTVIYFGFATCPDICPTALGKLSGALGVLEGDADKLNALFITVDPERDTPELLKSYLAFEPRFVGLTGAQEDVDAALDAYRVYRNKVLLEGSALGYTMDHSSLFYLMDAEGRFVAPIRDTLSVDELAAELRKHL